MAAGFDGSLTFDTALDSRGFEKGSKELLSAIRSLTNSVDQLGQIIQTAFSGMGRSVSSASKGVDELDKSMSKLGATAKKVGGSFTFDKANQKVSALGKEIDKLGNGLEKMDQDAGKIASGGVKDMRGALEKLEGSVAKTQNGLDDAKQKVESFGKTSFRTSEYQDLLDQREKAEKKLTEYTEKAERMYESGQNETQAWKKIQYAISEAKKEKQMYELAGDPMSAKGVSTKITELEEQAKAMKSAGLDQTGSWKILQEQINQTIAKIEQYEQAAREMEESGKDSFMGSDTAEYEQYMSQLHSIESELDRIYQKSLSAFTPKFENAGGENTDLEEIEAASTVFGTLKEAAMDAFETIRYGATAVFQTISHPITLVKFLLQSLGPVALSAAASIAKMAGGAVISGLHAAANGLRAAASAAKNLALNLARAAATRVGGAISSLGSKLKEAAAGFLHLGKNSKSASKGLSGGFKTVLKYGLGIRSVFVLVNKLRRALLEGLGNVANHSAATRNAINGLKTSLTNVKNALGAAFSPIVTAVAPYLTKFINMLATAINYVGAFFAALTGAKTYTKAIAQTSDAFDGVSNSASDAADSAKEAKRQLAGFDDLEILSDDKGSGGGGGGGGGGGAGGLFTEEEIDASVSEFAELLKKAWEDADFTEIGTILGTKLRDALNLIPWEAIQTVAGKIGKSIATFINGGIEVEGLADAIGNTIGQGLNTLLIGLNSFVTNLHWGSLGTFIADGMNAAISIINWGLLADTIATGLNGIFEAASTWANRFHFDALGDAIRDTVRDALGKLKWEDAQEAASSIGSGIATALNNVITPGTFSSVARAIAEALNTGIAGLYSLVSTIEWKQWGSALAAGINTFFATFDFVKAGLTFSEGALGILDAIKTALQGVQWGQAGEKIKEGLQSVKWDEIFTALSEAIGTAFGGIASFVGGLIGDGFTAAKDYFAQTIESVGGDIPTGIFLGIINGFKGIATWIKTNILTPFIDGFKSVFGISSPSTVMAEQGGYLISGMLNGIINALKNITTWVSDNILTPIKNALGAGLELGISLVKSGWETVTGWLGIAADGVIATAQAGIELIKKGWETVTGWLGIAADGVIAAAKAGVELVKNGWKTVTDWLGIAADGVIAAAKAGVELVKNGWETVTGWLGVAKDGVVATAKAAVELVKKGWTTLSGWLGTLSEAVEVGVSLAKSGWSTVSSWLSGFWGTITDGAMSIVVGLTKTWSTVSSWLGNFWGTINDGALSLAVQLSQTWGTVSKWISGFWGTIQDGAMTIAVGLHNMFKSVTDWISGFLGDKFGTDGSMVLQTMLEQKNWTTVSDWISNFWGDIKDGILKLGVSLFLDDGEDTGNDTKDSHTVNVTGKVTELDQSGLTAEDKTINNSTANVDSVDTSNVPNSEKVLNGGKVNAASADTSGVPAKERIVKDGAVTISSASVGTIPESQKTVSGGKVNVSSASVGTIPEKQKTVSGGKVNVSSATTSGVPDKDKTIDKGKVNVSELKDNIPDAKKVLPASAQIKDMNIDALKKDNKVRIDTIAQFKDKNIDALKTDDKIRLDTIAQFKDKNVEALKTNDKVRIDTIAQFKDKNVDALKTNDKVRIDTIAQFKDKNVDALKTDKKVRIDSVAQMTEKAEKFDHTTNKMTANLNKKDETFDHTTNKMTGNIKELDDNAPKSDHEIKVTGVITKTKHRYSGAQEAEGGVFSGGSWHSLPNYAKGFVGRIPRYAKGGLLPTHGTMFVAGEKGAEAVGHINGRTEVLNRSQMASAVYSAVVAGMARVASDVGTAIVNHMSVCANAIISNLAPLHTINTPDFAAAVSALGKVSYTAPVLASGTVLPYSVAQMQKETSVEFRNALDASNEELAQTFISALGAQTASLVSAIRTYCKTEVNVDYNSLVDRMIDDINRRTLMLNASPLKG